VRSQRFANSTPYNKHELFETTVILPPCFRFRPVYVHSARVLKVWQWQPNVAKPLFVTSLSSDMCVAEIFPASNMFVSSNCASQRCSSCAFHLSRFTSGACNEVQLLLTFFITIHLINPECFKTPMNHLKGI
jgi:hypothetical protein